MSCLFIASFELTEKNVYRLIVFSGHCCGYEFSNYAYKY